VHIPVSNQDDLDLRRYLSEFFKSWLQLFIFLDLFSVVVSENSFLLVEEIEQIFQFPFSKSMHFFDVLDDKCFAVFINLHTANHP
jgi:hypothetical protein